MEEDKERIVVKAPKFCRKCKVHNQSEPWREGHRRICPYMLCTCDGCTIVEFERKRARDSQRETRRLKRQVEELMQQDLHKNKPAFVIPEVPPSTSKTHLQTVGHHHGNQFKRQTPSQSIAGNPPRNLVSSPLMMYGMKVNQMLTSPALRHVQNTPCLLSPYHQMIPTPLAMRQNAVSKLFDPSSMQGTPPNVSLEPIPWRMPPAIYIPGLQVVPKVDQSELDSVVCMDAAPVEKCACADCMQNEITVYTANSTIDRSLSVKQENPGDSWQQK